MTHSIIRRLSLLTLLLTLATALPSLAEEGQIYTIKKGDTLWGLSKRFMNDPYYWPNMWARNPKVTNPHLIFPGQKVRILNGRLEIIPAYPSAEQSASSLAIDELPEAETVVKIKSAGSSAGFILDGEQPLGILVDSTDNRVLLTKDDQVFLKMNDPTDVVVGDTYGLYQAGQEVHHPVSKEVIGTMMSNLGFLQVTGSTGQTVSAKIGEIYREVERGAELFEYIPPFKEITLLRGSSDAQGMIIAGRDAKIAQALTDIVFVDLGSNDGVQTGNLLYISRPRLASEEMIKIAGEIELPDQVLGAAVVVDANARTSSALIIKSVDAMYIGDNVRVVSDRQRPHHK